MQITVALDGSLERNLTLSPGDEVTIELDVYEADGDAATISYTNPLLTVGDDTTTYPISEQFTVPDDLCRTAFRLTVEISGVTTTVAFGYLTPLAMAGVSCGTCTTDYCQ